jgi:hypothetical protein
MIVREVLRSGNVEQIVLALKGVLNHRSIRPHLPLRVSHDYNSEFVEVAVRAAAGIESLVREVTEGKHTGGRSNDCRALLRMITMCLARRMAEH